MIFRIERQKNEPFPWPPKEAERHIHSRCYYSSERNEYFVCLISDEDWKELLEKWGLFKVISGYEGSTPIIEVS